jgi:threonine synthase
VSLRYACSSCGREYRTSEVIYRCPACAGGTAGEGFQRGNLLTVFDPPSRARAGDRADPHSLLPMALPHWAAFSAGNTPVVEPERLREKTGFSGLFFKDDTRNPSGSLKDRASLLVAEQAASHGRKRVALASTGNAGASMACAGAACGLEVVLFVPAAAPKAKLLQSLLFGARVVPVTGTYDDAFSLSISYTEAFGGVNRNTGYNPLTIEGKKTAAVEMYNQLGREAPDAVYIPTGDGVIFSGVWKGFSDLLKAGYVEKLPALVAVQASGSNAIARSWREGREILLERASTIADSLAVASPACGGLVLSGMRESSGRAVEVSDGEIRDAQAELCRESGLFVEPSSAAAWAGFLKDRGNLERASRVVVLLTGTGFKDIAAAERLVSLPAPCAPDLESAVKLLESEYGLRSR